MQGDVAVAALFYPRFVYMHTHMECKQATKITDVFHAGFGYTRPRLHPECSRCILRYTEPDYRVLELCVLLLCL